MSTGSGLDPAPEFDDQGGLSDLFGYEDETTTKRRSPALVWVVRSVLLAAVLAAVPVFALRLVDLKLSYLLAAAGVFALLVLHRVIGRIQVPSARQSRRRYRASPEAGDTGGPDGLRSVLGWWETRLDRSRSDQQRFARSVQPLLAELIDERLRQRHGLTRASDPERARALLGDRLWRVLGDPAVKPPSPRELAELVAAAEKL